jgi:MFS family permease
MEADLGFSRAQITGALSIGLLASALVALPLGRWIDRHGARGVMSATEWSNSRPNTDCRGCTLIGSWSMPVP